MWSYACKSRPRAFESPMCRWWSVRGLTEQILTSPPFIAIEILSKDDRISQMHERIDDYLNFGVRYVWLIDPRTRRAWFHTKASSHESKDGILRTEDPAIELPLPKIFHALES